MLALIQGKPLIQHTYESACRSPIFSKVLVATDSEEIAEVIRAIGDSSAVILTSPKHVNGTDRVIEAYGKCGFEADIVLNWQGDQPFVEPRMVEDLLNPCLNGTAKGNIVTLACPLKKEDYTKPEMVKVVCSQSGQALYFSRSPIPYCVDANLPLSSLPVYHHIGMYAFCYDVLKQLPSPDLQTPLATAESLEQLRFLECDEKIYVHLTAQQPSQEVNTPADLAHVRASVEQQTADIN